MVQNRSHCFSLLYKTCIGHEFAIHICNFAICNTELLVSAIGKEGRQKEVNGNGSITFTLGYLSNRILNNTELN